ncbi:MAG TPA: GGDEF domain-containing protein [Burkholderiales bacterium]|nr:GGDEF domain-containing protein [Burkholderiales bacterium]
MIDAPIDAPIHALRAARPLRVPGGILAAAAFLVWLGHSLPPSLAGLKSAGPYFALTAAAALAWGFNRGRAFILAASLLGGYTAWQFWHHKAVYTALVLLVPLNVLAAMLYAERGARYRAAYAWLALIAAEMFVLMWVAAAQNRWLYEPWFLRSPPTPLLGRLACAAAFAAAVWRTWPDFKPIPVGNAAAVAAFFLAAEWAASPGAYALFMSASGVVMIAALVQESHQLAFRDPLTGLPGRRALDERLRSLGERYAVGMVDVDHFKQFNDTHGHDVGDQVLRLVGGRLEQVGGGGVAYRYGGEEFCVLFPDADIGEAEAALEAIRASIETYKMAVRGADRPKQAEEGAKRRGAAPVDKVLSVTVSIGVAVPSTKHRAPREVIMAADEALYRAKKAGRNRVSR